MKKIIILLSAIIIFLIIIVGILLLKNKEYNKEFINKSNYYVLEDSNIDIDNYYLFQNYNDFKKYFNDTNINEKSFEEYNYVAIKIMYDECSESDLIPSNYFIKNNTLDVTFKYTASCGVCAPRYLYYIIKLDKSIKFSDVKLNYEANNKLNCDPNLAYKPIIYLYPIDKTNITIKLLNDNYLTTTYPKYKTEWNVTAYANGRIVSMNREYYGLYWEGINYNSKITNEGFIVSGEETISFLEEKLKILGLNDREANEFIIYWLPKLEKNKYNYIRFASIDEINNYMPIEVNPKPDSIIRIMMEYKPLDKKIKIDEQKLVTPKREGFTLVEWGGSLIK